MPAAITIPISIFELTVSYEKPEIRLAAERVTAVETLLAAYAPWNPDVDDMEIITTGKLSEQGVRIKVPSQGFSFFFGPTYCRFTKDPANWADADRIIDEIKLSLDALRASSGLAYGKHVSTLALHLQLTTVSSRDILRKFIAPEVLALDTETPRAMAVISNWPRRKITLDGSASIANGIFLRNEREFAATVSFEEIKQSLLNDELELFRLLDVQEVVP